MFKKTIFYLVMIMAASAGLACFGAAEPIVSQRPVPTSLYDSLLGITRQQISRLPGGIVPLGDLATRATQIIEGGNIAYCILHNQPLPFNIIDRTEYLRAIVDLIWYFYSEAINKGQAFNEGTFVLADEGFHFYHFLMNYVKMVNPAVKDDPTQDPASMKSDNPYAYSRRSSHHTEIQYNHSDALKLAKGTAYNGKYRHYGIDIRWNSGLDYNALPTGNKSHILFGKIQEGSDLVFIKLEKNGVYVEPAAKKYPSIAPVFPKAATQFIEIATSPDIAAHTYHFIQTQIPKFIERNVSPGIRDALVGWIEFDDSPLNRKERCQWIFLSAVLEAVDRSTLPPDLYEAFVTLSEILGIKFVFLMTQFVETGNIKLLSQLESLTKMYLPSDLGKPELLVRLANYIQKDSSLHDELRRIMRPIIADFDHCDLRTGREIVLTPCDMLSCFYFHDLVNHHQPATIGDFCNKLLLLNIQCRNSLKQVIEGNVNGIQAINDIKQKVEALRQDYDDKMRALSKDAQLPLLKCLSDLGDLGNLLSLIFSTIEDELVAVHHTSLFPALIKLDRSYAVQQLNRISYRQLIRSLLYITDQKLRDDIIKIIGRRIDESLRSKVLTIDDLYSSLSKETLKSILSGELVRRIEAERRVLGQDLQNQVFGQRIVLINNHAALTGNLSPRLLITVQRKDNERWRVVVEHGASVDIGSSDIANPTFPIRVTYEPYGEFEKIKGLLGFLGVASSPTSINMQEYLARGQIAPDQQLIVTILDRQPFFSIKPIAKHQLTSLIDAFASVKYWISDKRMTYTLDQLQKRFPLDLARYILGLPKEFDETSVQIRYKRLLEEWNPALYPENTQLAESITGYINWAYQTLLSHLAK